MDTSPGTESSPTAHPTPEARLVAQLRERRNELMMSQRELGERAGISPATVWSIEVLRHPPQAETVAIAVIVLADGRGRTFGTGELQSMAGSQIVALGLELGQRRANRQLTRTELSLRSGVGGGRPDRIRLVETGAEPPSLGLLCTLAAALDAEVAIDWSHGCLYLRDVPRQPQMD